MCCRNACFLPLPSLFARPASLSGREGSVGVSVGSQQQLLLPEVALLWRVWAVRTCERMNVSDGMTRPAGRQAGGPVEGQAGSRYQ